jgi:MFS family permease
VSSERIVMSARRLSYGLSRELWLVEVGVFLNMLGYGAVLPFEVVYLHDARGFDLGVAGLVVGTLTGVAVVAAPFCGVLIDRFGARVAASVAGLSLAAGYAGLAFATVPAWAFAAAVLAGIGNGGLIPAQSTLVAALAPPELRHRANAVSRVAVNAGAGLGAAAGGIVAARGLDGFVGLFLANALTYVVYVTVLWLAVREDARPEPVPGGYRVVARDRAFIQLALINVAMIAIGWGFFSWIVPAYADAELDVGARGIGLLLLANAATVVLAQVPIARLAEGRRRVVMVAVAAGLFVVAGLLVAGAGMGAPATALAALFVAVMLVGLGECFHTTALFPLVAELAPDGLRGRYMAAIGLSWWVGLALAPTLGTALLSVTPAGTFVVAAGVAAGAGAAALALERRLPAASRRTPRPSRASHATPVVRGADVTRARSASRVDRATRLDPEAGPRTRPGMSHFRDT